MALDRESRRLRKSNLIAPKILPIAALLISVCDRDLTRQGLSLSYMHSLKGKLPYHSKSVMSCVVCTNLAQINYHKVDQLTNLDR